MLGSVRNGALPGRSRRVGAVPRRPGRWRSPLAAAAGLRAAPGAAPLRAGVWVRGAGAPRSGWKLRGARTGVPAVASASERPSMFLSESWPSLGVRGVVTRTAANVKRLGGRTWQDLPGGSEGLARGVLGTWESCGRRRAISPETPLPWRRAPGGLPACALEGEEELSDSCFCFCFFSVIHRFAEYVS